MSDHVTLPGAKAFLVEKLAALLEASPNDIDPDVDFDRFGLDSAKAVELTADISDWCGIELDPTVLYDYPTLTALSNHLVELVNSDVVASVEANSSKVSV